MGLALSGDGRPAGEVVDNYEVTRRIAIRQWWVDGIGTVYDWFNDLGDTSDEFFDSIEDAKRDAEDH